MTKNTISQFIWGYQPHFRRSVEREFEKLSKQIGAEVAPDVFLVGIAMDAQAGHLVCVEPEDTHRYNQATFAHIQQEYLKVRKADPRANVFQSLDIAQKNEDRRLHLRSVRNAVIACIEAQDAGGGNLTFCSLPTEVGHYEVCVVLQVPVQQIASCPMIATTERRISPYHVYPVDRSLVYAAANVLLGVCFDALWMPDVIDLACNTEDMAREAGRRMMLAPASLGDAVTSLDSASLYEACNIISATRYEGAPTFGGMLISAREHRAVNATIEFAHPIRLQDHRGIRKLLELATEEGYLLCDGRCVYGVGSLGEGYDPSAEDVFQVRFASHYKWELIHGGTTLMVVEYSNPRVPSLPFNLSKFRRDLPRFFPSIEEIYVEHLCAIVLKACTQRHGTTVVITADAAQEAARLSGQSTLIQPMRLSEGAVRMVTSIDGAILLDDKGICHAIGVILDGEASPNGNPSRGGRYNSAVRYTEANPATLSVVVSMDGTVDILPDLRPQMSRRVIDDHLDELVRLAALDRVAPGDHNKAVSKITNVSFYLTQEDCALANRLIKEIKDRIDWEVGAIIISCTEFKPHPEMDETYYIYET